MALEWVKKAMVPSHEPETVLPKELLVGATKLPAEQIEAEVQKIVTASGKTQPSFGFGGSPGGILQAMTASDSYVSTLSQYQSLYDQMKGLGW